MNIELDKRKIKEIKMGDTRYPSKLLHIYHPPKILYVLGNETILNEPSIAIIGCRDCSNYGRNSAYYFAKELAQREIITISGLARGIDTYVHKGTVRIGHKTIAVLGCGLNIVYPPENKELYKDIIQNGGAIVSEYPLGTKPEKHHFPERNRIISGLSDGVLVIEAKKRSGTLITVEHALEQGKDVYAVPRKYWKSKVLWNKWIN